MLTRASDRQSSLCRASTRCLEYYSFNSLVFQIFACIDIKMFLLCLTLFDETTHVRLHSSHYTIILNVLALTYCDRTQCIIILCQFHLRSGTYCVKYNVREIGKFEPQFWIVEWTQVEIIRLKLLHDNQLVYQGNFKLKDKLLLNQNQIVDHEIYPFEH